MARKIKASRFFAKREFDDYGPLVYIFLLMFFFLNIYALFQMFFFHISFKAGTFDTVLSFPTIWILLCLCYFLVVASSKTGKISIGILVLAEIIIHLNDLFRMDEWIVYLTYFVNLILCGITGMLIAGEVKNNNGKFKTKDLIDFFLIALAIFAFVVTLFLVVRHFVGAKYDIL